MSMMKHGLSTLVIFIAIVATSLGWSGRTHFWINSAATIRAARAMPGWEAYKERLAVLSIGPDLWKENDSSEYPRHFIDLEYYGYPKRLALVSTQTGIVDSVTGVANLNEGTAPWVIVELTERLVVDMRATNWVEAIRVAGALGHYVGDIHMPLHTTSNYDGQESGNMGLHLRWENQMPLLHMRGRRVPDGEPVVLDQIWDHVTNWAVTAHQDIAAILLADNQAAWTAGGNVESSAYYDELWSQTSSIFYRQIERSAEALASLWFTAWVRAGRPPIPSLPEDVSTDSIFQTKPRPSEGLMGSAGLFLAVLMAFGTWVIWKSMTQKAPEKTESAEP